MSDYRQKQVNFLRRGADELTSNQMHSFAIEDAVEAYLAGATALERLTPLEDHLKSEIKHLADARRLIVEMESRIRDLEAQLAAAENLLSVIHRDGGHHTEAVGFVRSCEDAQAKLLVLVLERDGLQCELAEARKDGARLDWFEKNGKWVERESTLIDATSMTFEPRWRLCSRDRSYVSRSEGYVALRSAIDAALKGGEK